MPWPNLLWAVAGVDCQWVQGACNGPYLLLSDVVLVPLLLLALVGVVTCLRLTVGVLRWMLRSAQWLFLSREERIVAQLKQQSRAAATDYLRPYR